MAAVDHSVFEGVSHPEIIIGLVAPVGAPLPGIQTAITEVLNGFSYTTQTLRLSEYLSGFDLPTPEPLPLFNAYDTYITKMKRGTELRKAFGGGEALACVACAKIQGKRPKKEPRSVLKSAFILSQLKHPDEVVLLQQVYGDAFILFGISCPEQIRLQHLRSNLGMTEDQAEELIKIDNGEQILLGQQVAKTFHKADFFINSTEAGVNEQTKSAIYRYFSLLFGTKIHSPTRDEYGLFLAYSSSLRSTDLSRQVGAAILDKSGDVVSLGTNEVPSYGGGQYWDDGEVDGRDFAVGRDENEVIRRECLREVLGLLSDKHPESINNETLTGAVQKLKESRLMNLTEFGRAVHAEMEAILAAARMGIPVKGKELFSTTFPCHNCAKHIVGSGIERVVYVEPYPKSLAERLHGDAITFSSYEGNGSKVRFEPFCGVSPRQYSLLFSNASHAGVPMRRKDDYGNLTYGEPRLRLRASPLTHIQREAIAAKFLEQRIEVLEKKNRPKQRK